MPTPNWALSRDGRRTQVDRYFAVDPSPRDRFFALLFLAAGSAAVAAYILGLLLSAEIPGAGAILVMSVMAMGHGLIHWGYYRHRLGQAQPKPRDRDLDDLLEADLVQVGQQAMDMLGIAAGELDLTAADVRRTKPGNAPTWLANTTLNGPPMVFGPVIDTKNQRIGLDNVWRFRSYTVMVLCPTAHHLGVYQCTLDIGSGKISKQELREYFYGDVVTVSQVEKSEELTMRGLGADRRVTTTRWAKTTFRQMEVVVSSGDHSEILAGLSWLSGPPITLQESGLEYLVVALRNLLRNKRPVPPAVGSVG